VYKGLLLELFITFTYWFKSTWKPSLVFSRKKFAYHYNFGYKLTLSSVLNAVFNEIYSLIIARFANITLLGYYNRAKKYNNLPMKVITKTITKVTYPLLSKIKDDPDKISKVYQEILRSLFFLVTPIMASVAVVAKPLFTLVFTEKWLFAVPYFQILTLSSILLPVHSMNLNVFKVYGRTDLSLKLSIYKKGLVALAVIPFFLFGMNGLLIGIVVNSYISLFINSYYSEDMINYKLTDQLKDLFPTFCTTILSCGLGYMLLESIDESPLLIQVTLIPVLILSTYLLMNRLIGNKSYYEFLNFAQMFLNRFRESIKKR
ncbi:MAG: oligosaccharide flippase family protein, partial [Bacteroidota bacterium]